MKKKVTFKSFFFVLLVAMEVDEVAEEVVSDAESIGDESSDEEEEMELEKQATELEAVVYMSFCLCRNYRTT